MNLGAAAGPSSDSVAGSGMTPEMFSLAEARYIVDRWRMDYNHHAVRWWSSR